MWLYAEVDRDRRGRVAGSCLETVRRKRSRVTMLRITLRARCDRRRPGKRCQNSKLCRQVSKTLFRGAEYLMTHDSNNILTKICVIQ